MNIDAKRHKLLGILAKQRRDLELKKAEYNALGVSFDRIYKELNCDEDELHSITSDLYTSDEIGYHDAQNIVGVFCKDKGVTAFSNKKYLTRINERRKDLIKIILPILALVISLASLYFSNFSNIRKSRFESENNDLKNKLDTLQVQVNNLKLELEDKVNTDSLNLNIKGY